MTTTGSEQFFDSWQKQVEASVRMMDAVIEAAAKMRAVQVSAAKEMQESAQALQKALADAKDAQQLWSAQWNWALATGERSAAYWRSLFDAMNEANGILARGMQEGIPGMTQMPSGGALPATGFEAVDNIYREMLKTSQHLLGYATATSASQPKKAA